MIHHRKLQGLDLFQIVEMSGPTHDATWMFPDLPAHALHDNANWLFPHLWSAYTNRHVFTMQLFVLKRGGRAIVIDTGVGNSKRRPVPSQNMLNTPVLDWLAAIGVAQENVTDVVHTHLHGDHVGWNTQIRDGRWVPTFPNATYHLPRLDWDSYMLRYMNGERDVLFGSFADSVIPVFESGQTREFDDGSEIGELLRATAVPGHSPGQMALELHQARQKLVFCGDVLHSPIQVLYPNVNSRWCELPDVARTTRATLLQRAASEQLTLLPAHAIGLTGWNITRCERGFSVACFGTKARECAIT